MHHCLKGLILLMYKSQKKIECCFLPFEFSFCDQIKRVTKMNWNSSNINYVSHSTNGSGGGGVMVWGIFSWHTLGPLVPIEHHLNATVYPCIVSDHVHPFMTTVYLSSDGYFQQDNAACRKAQIISDWFLQHENEFTFLKWPPQSPDLNLIEHLWDVVEWENCIMDVQPTNLQQLRDAIISIWTKISEEYFQNFVEFMPQRIKSVLKWVPTQY